MVDADAVVPLPGAGLVVPERVGVRATVPARTASVKPRSVSRRKACRLSGWNSASPSQSAGLRGVDRLGNDVVVAGEHEGLLQGEKRRAHAPPAAPSRPACRGTSRSRSDCRSAGRSRRRGRHRPSPRRSPRCSAPARRSSSPGRPRRTSSSGSLRQDRDTVEALLPVTSRPVAERPRKASRGNPSSTDLISCRQSDVGFRRLRSRPAPSRCAP